MTSRYSEYTCRDDQPNRPQPAPEPIPFPPNQPPNNFHSSKIEQQGTVSELRFNSITNTITSTTANTHAAFISPHQNLFVTPSELQKQKSKVQDQQDCSYINSYHCAYEEEFKSETYSSDEEEDEQEEKQGNAYNNIQTPVSSHAQIYQPTSYATQEEKRINRKQKFAKKEAKQVAKQQKRIEKRNRQAGDTLMGHIKHIINLSIKKPRRQQTSTTATGQHEAVVANTTPKVRSSKTVASDNQSTYQDKNNNEDKYNDIQTQPSPQQQTPAFTASQCGDVTAQESSTPKIRSRTTITCKSASVEPGNDSADNSQADNSVDDENNNEDQAPSTFHQAGTLQLPSLQQSAEHQRHTSDLSRATTWRGRQRRPSSPTPPSPSPPLSPSPPSISTQELQQRIEAQTSLKRRRQEQYEKAIDNLAVRQRARETGMGRGLVNEQRLIDHLWQVEKFREF